MAVMNDDRMAGAFGHRNSDDEFVKIYTVHESLSLTHPRIQGG